MQKCLVNISAIYCVVIIRKPSFLDKIFEAIHQFVRDVEPLSLFQSHQNIPTSRLPQSQIAGHLEYVCLKDILILTLFSVESLTNWRSIGVWMEQGGDRYINNCIWTFLFFPVTSNVAIFIPYMSFRTYFCWVYT